jgi:hypothetical protein
MEILFKIEIVIGSLIIMLSLLGAIFICAQFNLPQYLRFFYLYPLLAFALSLVTITNTFFYKFSKYFISICESLYVILEPIFWGYFFVSFFKNAKTKNLVKIVSSILIFLTLFLVINSGAKGYNHEVVSINNLSYCFYCSIYFVNLFRADPLLTIYKEPLFWIISGVFFYSAVSLPLFPFSDYYRRLNSRELFLPFISAINLVIIIMHLLFIKGYQCLIKQIKA